MRQIIQLFVIVFLLLTTSCQTQKIAATVADVKKLELNKDQFTGKPLKLLLEQIKPKIKAAIGDPADISKNRIKTISFFFIDKKVFLIRDSKGETPTRITVVLEPAKERKRPLSGSVPWTKEQTKEYGDMIIIRFWVRGEN